MAATTKARKAPPTPAGNDNDFVHTFSDGTEITVPSLAVARKPNFDEFTSAQTLPDEGVREAVLTRLFLMSACGPKAWNVVKVQQVDEVMKFVEKWGDHSGVTLGE